MLPEDELQRDDAVASPDTGDLELLHSQTLPMSAESILQDVTRYFGRTLGRRTVSPRQPFLFQSLALAVRDRLMERWNETRNSVQRDNRRQVCYLSLEYLMGRLLRNALLSLGAEGATAEALQKIGVDLEDLCDREQDAGLGNGGLGRLAACFLDSCATLALPVMGYGLRYHYGMFRQRIDDGRQFEEPDNWLREGFPWEIKRIELAQVIRFGGRSVRFVDDDGHPHHAWIETHEVLAIPYDVPVPGYRNGIVNTLRLWSAAATNEFDLEEFNAGSYADAVAAKNEAENITMVLYPNADTAKGQELRVRQQYFLVSASLQDTLRRWRERHGDDVAGFADLNCFQLNDTHPAIAVPELMRLLMDEYRLGWDAAWAITSRSMAYTNHTLLPEALEQWPAEMLDRLVPRLMDIIREIDARHRAEVESKWPGDNERARRMALISDGHTPMVRMAYLAIVGSFSVNGVAELHSRLLRDGLFRDFDELSPGKLNNKTNGVTQRRWLAACNPRLSDAISKRLGDGWVTDLEQLRDLDALADDAQFQAEWRDIRRANKRRLAADIRVRTGIAVDVESIFDVQVKRIHEYKRQLLNLLHAIHLYDRYERGDGDDIVPRTIVIGGKAAPGYVMAKHVIKSIGDVARVINSAPSVRDRLKLVFYPDYNVSAMELICPAADVSAQISTAGKEASGTGNMKLMMNGAVTIGTLDGANVEIIDAVGADNFYLFGLTVEQIGELKPAYDPGSIVDDDDDFSRVMSLLRERHFSTEDCPALDAIVHSILDPGDPWMTAADFRSFVDTQRQLEAGYRDTPAWTRASIRNCAASGRFSTDRTISDYNRDIWRLQSIDLPSS